MVTISKFFLGPKRENVHTSPHSIVIVPSQLVVYSREADPTAVDCVPHMIRLLTTPTNAVPYNIPKLPTSTQQYTKLTPKHNRYLDQGFIELVNRKKTPS